MIYTIEIDESSQKAKSVVDMLKMLASDYDFINIFEKQEPLSFMTSSQKEDFRNRYIYTLENIEEGKTWAEIEETYKSNDE